MNIGIITSGGDCGGLNAVVKGAAQMAYNNGMKSFIVGVKTILLNRQEKDRQIVNKNAITIGIILTVFAFVWLVSRKLSRRSPMRVKTKRKKSAYAHEWQETFNAITDGVCIINKNSIFLIVSSGLYFSASK